MKLKGEKIMESKDNGVSEVVGTLLILAITVALFATVFTFVNTMPRATNEVQVTVYPEYAENSKYFYLNLTIVSGTPLKTSGIICVLSVNGETYSSNNGQNWIIPTDIYIYPGNGPDNTIQFKGNAPLSGNFYAFIEYRYTDQIIWQMSFYYVPPG